jgi:hypothetical protein
MSPQPCPPQPITARFNLLLAAVEAALPRVTSGPPKTAALTLSADVLRKRRREKTNCLWEPPVTILRNPVESLGSSFCLDSVMATPFVGEFMVLALCFSFCFLFPILFQSLFQTARSGISFNRTICS